MEDKMRRILFAIATFLLATTASPVLSQTPKSEAPPKAVKTTASRAPAAKATASSPVNINSASVAQLQTLPGIGASTAQRIVDYRQKNGAFKKIEELMNVKGIGEKSFLKLKPVVTVGADKGDRPAGEK
jgi:competence protein ComEA